MSSSNQEDYQKIFHWAETQQDGKIPSFSVRKNDPYQVLIRITTCAVCICLQLSSIKQALAIRMIEQSDTFVIYVLSNELS